jgi:glyoxylase-like metal-dependent hydrolase (beta-lactamase superfamily II)
MVQLLKDVYLLSGHSYGLHPNVYGIVLPGRQGIALVDTGLNNEDRVMIEKNIAYWDLTCLPVTHVLITHSHFDHAGNAFYFKQKGAVILAGDGDAQGIAAGDERTINYAYPMPFPACEADQILHDMDRLDLRGLVVTCHLAPGHSRGSVVYEMTLEGRNVLFTGDFLMAAQDCVHGLTGIPVGEDYDPAAYLASLRKIRQLKADVILGGHGQPALEKGNFIINSAYRNMLANRSFSNAGLG